MKLAVKQYRMHDGLYAPHVQVGDAIREVKLAAQPGGADAMLTCPIKEVCIAGPRGPGKTITLLCDFGQNVGLGYGAAFKAIMFRRQMKGFDEFRSLAAQYLMSVFPDAQFNQNNNIFRFATGEMLTLRYFDDLIDYNSLQGASYQMVIWDELTQWGDDKAFRMMYATLRSPVPNIPLLVRSATNPDGPGHNWVRRRYQAGDARAMHDYTIGPIIPADDVGPQRVMIYTRLNENQLVYKAQPDYINATKASAVDENKYEAWVNGSWDILSGDMFGDLWPDAKQYMILPDFPADVIPPGWRKDRAMDWGSSEPFCIQWYLETDGSDLDFNGQIYRFRAGSVIIWKEWYGCTKAGPNVGCRLTPAQIAKGIIEREVSWGLRFRDVLRPGKWVNLVKTGAADGQIFADGLDAGPSIASQFEEPVTTDNGDRFRGIFWYPADKSSGSRVQGWQTIRAHMRGAIPSKDGYREKPGLYVCEGVKSFFDHVVTLPRDPKNPEDSPKRGVIDHSADCLRYRLRHLKQAAVSSRAVIFGSDSRLRRM